jgi:hypothetical protein
MNRSTTAIAFVLGLLVCSGTPRSWAQESSAARPQAAQATGYRLDLSINEMEDGKKINTRHYSMNLTDDSATKELKIGTRVPVEPEQGKFQYIDLGTNISAKMYLNQNSLTLDVRVEVSSLASADQATRGQPLVRQMVLSGRTLVIPDRAMVIGSVDDPNSKREFQLDATATKIK